MQREISTALEASPDAILLPSMRQPDRPPPGTPIADNSVNALAISGGIVYVGGDFTTLEASPGNGSPRSI